MRVNRCKEILNRAIHMKESLGKFIGDATRLTDKLLELCNKPVLTKINRLIHIVGLFKNVMQKLLLIVFISQFVILIIVIRSYYINNYISIVIIINS